MSTVGTARRWLGRPALAILIALGALGATVGGAQTAGATTSPQGRILARPCLDLRDAPTVSGTSVVCIPYNATIAIQCTDAGDAVRGPYGVLLIWDRTTYNGKTGFVPDALVYTGTNGPVAPSCLGPGKGRVVHSPCLYERNAPSLSAPSGVCIQSGAVITITCTKRGDSVTGPWGPSNVWDYTSYAGLVGYVPDARVYTATSKPVAKPC